MRTIKLIMIITLLFISVGTMAQLKVEDTGRVNIGFRNNLSQGLLKMGNDGLNNGISFYDYTYGGSPFSIYRESNLIYMTRGNGCANGLKITNDGRIVLGQHTTGWSSTGQGHFVVFTPTSIPSITAYSENMADHGDIIRSYAYNPLATLYAGWYIDNTTGGWYKNFSVLGNGEIYANSYFTTSDASTKENIETISNPLDKVLRLRGITFDSKVINTESTQKGAVADDVSKRSTQVVNEMESEKKRKRIGIIAQELEAVVPEAVRTTSEGHKAVAYAELVGLLIEAIKEQQLQIEDLKVQLETPVKTKSTTEKNSTGISSTVINSNQLYQNVPNPFSNSTEIRYFLEENIDKANLYIYDMQGKQIKNISNLSKGDSSITINGYDLKAGMYIYTLIVDGVEIDTKRMILTD